jgi:hypothetical protein
VTPSSLVFLLTAFSFAVADSAREVNHDRFSHPKIGLGVAIDVAFVGFHNVHQKLVE